MALLWIAEDGNVTVSYLILLRCLIVVVCQILKFLDITEEIHVDYILVFQYGV